MKPLVGSYLAFVLPVPLPWLKSPPPSPTGSPVSSFSLESRASLATEQVCEWSWNCPGDPARGSWAAKLLASEGGSLSSRESPNSRALPPHPAEPSNPTLKVFPILSQGSSVFKSSLPLVNPVLTADRNSRKEM